MFKTRFTELAGIQHPIMQGGMQHLGIPALASAVSNAGGLGTINITIYPELTDFEDALKQMKDLTDKPFAVNFSFTPGLNQGEKVRKYIELCQKHGVPLAETAGRSPKEFMPDFKAAGMKVIHKCVAVKHALSAQSIGVDAITMDGWECAGHPGLDMVGTFVLTNAAARALTVPVLAAGGVADGRGLAAALALGAQGVTVGTRFVASQECVIHQNFKDAIVNAKENDTLICQRSIGNQARYMKNATSLKALALDEAKAGVEETLAVVSGAKSKEYYVTGDTEGCVFTIGQCAGLIHDVPTVKEIIDGMLAEASAVIDGIGALRS